MASSDESLKAAARSAYERGRLLAAFSVLAYVVPATAAAAVLNMNMVHALVAGALLAIAAVVFKYRGGVYGRAVGPGLAAGLVAAVMAIAMCHFGVCEPGSAAPTLCGTISLLGGGISGAIVVRRALRLEEHRRGFLLSGALIAFLAGALGCTMFGVFGVAGLAIGVALSALPLGLIYQR